MFIQLKVIEYDKSHCNAQAKNARKRSNIHLDMTLNFELLSMYIIVLRQMNIVRRPHNWMDKFHRSSKPEIIQNYNWRCV